MNLNKLYSTGRVKRFHTTDLPAQTIGHHSWGVALICEAVYPKPHLPSVNLLMAALTHDCAESHTGDVPSPAFKAHPELAQVVHAIERQFNRENDIDYELTDRERHILRWADMLECVLYAEHCVHLGVLQAQFIMDRAQSYLLEIGFPTSEAKELYNGIFGE